MIPDMTRMMLERRKLVAESVPQPQARLGDDTGSVVGGGGTYSRTRSTYTLTFMMRSCCCVVYCSVAGTRWKK